METETQPEVIEDEEILTIRGSILEGEEFWIRLYAEIINSGVSKARYIFNDESGIVGREFAIEKLRVAAERLERETDPKRLIRFIIERAREQIRYWAKERKQLRLAKNALAKIS